MTQQFVHRSALHAPPHLDVASVTVTRRLVDDGARVYRLDAVAELIDAHGTETEAIAHAEGYLQYPPIGATDERGGIVAWIHDAPPTDRDTATSTTGRPDGPLTDDVTYLTSTWSNVPRRAIAGTDEPSPLALLIEAIARSASFLTDPSTGNDGQREPTAARSELTVIVHDPVGRGRVATIPDVHTLSVAGLTRALDTPIERKGGAGENTVRIQLFMAPTTGAVYAPLPVDVQIAVTVSEPADTVVAVADDLGSTSIAVQRCRTVVFAYRHTTVTTERVAAFSKDIAARIQHHHM
ncbi:hypothetical protein [Nocardia farcinica]|uniref:hypothetical protein n=1 Tax=Nocardia farcinica TaxID=37329 RepID=UPI00378C4361